MMGLRARRRTAHTAAARPIRPDVRDKANRAGMGGRVKGRPDPGLNPLTEDARSAWERFAHLKPSTADEPGIYRSRPRRMREGVSRAHPYVVGGSDTHRSRTQKSRSGSPPNHYALLGIARNASAEHVERAFRQCVRLIHPDQFLLTDPPRHRVAHEQLKDVIAAGQVLRDPAERARYDAMLDGLPLASRLGPPPRDDREAQAAPAA
jgi:hypothetical protein